MAKNLNIIEEYDLRALIESPELSYVENSVLERKKVAKNILNRKAEEILLINKTGFYIDSVFAGLDEKKIEFFAKNSPLEYKKNLIKIFQDKEMIDGVWEVARAMDEDEGNNLMSNQDRIKKVIQYIRDNQSIFHN